MSNATFKTSFKSFATEGDFITVDAEGFTVTARIEYDDCCDRPDERDEGFWPSIDPVDAGYIGSSDIDVYEAAKKRAEEIMKAWARNEWFYCGIVLSVEKNDVMLNCHAASLWGVEANYPGTENEYLTIVANDLLDEALAEGKAIIARLTK